MKIKIFIARLFLILFISLLIYSSFKIIMWYKDNINTSSNNNNIKNISKEIIKDDNTVDVDFNSLLQANDEVVGWIKVNNTNIDYPVVKHGDNDYYLNHSFDKSYNSAGWIFMDYRNDVANLDNNTIIYGHGRRDGSMFGSLTKALDREWINNKDNLIINFTTINNRYLFKVFSIYYINTTDDYININYNEELLNTIIKRSIYKLDEDINISDKVLTLSTCYNNSKKLVVHAKLIYKSL